MMVLSHVVIGAAAWLAMAPAAGTRVDAIGLGCAVCGALLPDIDHPRSWVGRRLWLISWPVSLLLGHRGFTHSLLAVVAAGALLHHQGAGNRWLEPLLVGYLSHLAADLVSGGIPLLWPWRRSFAVRLCRTGSWSEVAVAALFVVLVLQGHPLR